MSTQRYKAVVEYLGSKYHGWAAAPGNTMCYSALMNISPFLSPL